MSWKRHPLAVPILTFAGTATFCFTIVMPIWDRIKDNEIANKNNELTKLREEPNQLKSKLDAITRQIDQVEAENQKLRADIDQLRPGDLFSLDDYYPRGFREVRIGDRIELVYKIYDKDGTIKDQEGWLVVKLRKPEFFNEVVYYYDEAAPVRTIRSVLFYLHGGSFTVIREQLIQKYGGKAIREDTKHGSPTLTWSDGKKTNFELSMAVLRINAKN